ncbi:MAG: hypothetical protein JST75_11750 [Bacteroidetes bacterium]|nr:hypothetical protein [Bacteroidota bacterium]
MPKVDKLILTVKSVLKKKYDEDFPELLLLLNQLVESDKQKGLNSLLIFLDDDRKFKSLRIKSINPSTAVDRDYKNCVDALYKNYDPDYIMIFGAIDVIPHQKLKNLLSPGDNEEDKFVPSDLPYACNEPYSTDPNKFLKPVRVIGRLPDINGVNDMKLVSTMIENIIGFKSKSKKDYEAYFAVSAEVWRKSTEKSIEGIFSGRSRVKLVPPSKYHWKRSQLKPLSHFFNCHGDDKTPYWMGQKGGRYPKSMTSAILDGEIQKNTIVAAECCYGAQLYHPAKDDLEETMPICNAYFKNGAIAFLGSTTIAYGNLTTNDQADFITQYFFMYVLSGASIGRALLEAKHKYIWNHGPDLSPTDLKTISQFNLLGDPSIHLVLSGKEKEKKTAGIIQEKNHEDNSRKERRKYLLSKGTALGSYVNKVEAGKKLVVGKKTKRNLDRIIADFKMKPSTGKTFKIVQNDVNRKTFRSKGVLASKYHIFLEKKVDKQFNQKLLSVKELGGEIVNVQLYTRKS